MNLMTIHCCVFLFRFTQIFVAHINPYQIVDNLLGSEFKDLYYKTTAIYYATYSSKLLYIKYLNHNTSQYRREIFNQFCIANNNMVLHCPEVRNQSLHMSAAIQILLHMKLITLRTSIISIPCRFGAPQLWEKDSQIIFLLLFGLDEFYFSDYYTFIN